MKKHVTRDQFDVIRTPLLTEKSVSRQERENAYSFEVHPTANKIQIQQAVEALFSVTVERVRTMNVRGKKRRLGWRGGRRPDWKKAIVTLKEGDKIELM